MPSNYPTLHELGITSLEEVNRYSLQTIDDVDLLRIVYNRKKGSFLPTSKKYRFPRTKKMVVVDSGSNKTENLNEISPFLSKVIDELEQLVSSKHSRVEQKKIINEELRRLEEEMHTRITYIQSMIEKLD